jgi:hypothetical protein
LDAASGQPLGLQVELLAELQRELDQPITIALKPWAETMAAFRAGALVPRPRLQLIRFHGVLAPNAKLRARVVPQGPEVAEPATEASTQEAGARGGPRFRRLDRAGRRGQMRGLHCQAAAGVALRDLTAGCHRTQGQP